MYPFTLSSLAVYTPNTKFSNTVLPDVTFALGYDTTFHVATFSLLYLSATLAKKAKESDPNVAESPVKLKP